MGFRVALLGIVERVEHKDRMDRDSGNLRGLENADTEWDRTADFDSSFGRYNASL